ncbi:uncharacterized protein LOC120686007 isoform X2 [Panicum virgatum]|uniref:uncharacterized protein LOC120686007 isoform X2 n=1 Tax=Panicum virgatum TaxID=38727 RepID=UPI0019D57280|nr:uncharacterized protein LOC120686007 isoform X2 [Panicum virgatum]
MTRACYSRLASTRKGNQHYLHYLQVFDKMPSLTYTAQSKLCAKRVYSSIKVLCKKGVELNQSSLEKDSHYKENIYCCYNDV